MAQSSRSHARFRNYAATPGSMSKFLHLVCGGYRLHRPPSYFLGSFRCPRGQLRCLLLSYHLTQDMVTIARHSSERASGNVHSKIIRAGRVGVIAVAVLTVTVVVNAVAGVQAVFGAVEGEHEGAGLDGKIFA